MISIFAIDTTLGRLDYNSLSDQALMEILIEGFSEDSKVYFQDEKGFYLDACEWEGVFCNDDSQIIRFMQPLSFHSGLIRLEFIPPNVTHFKLLSVYKYKGSLETVLLPSKLLELSISDNNFQGTIDFKGIPTNLIVFEIGGNAFSGACELAFLLKELIFLSVGRNSFTGNVRLDNLPQMIESLDVSSNQLDGSICLQSLPENLRKLWINNNAFSGKFHLDSIPKSMYELLAHGNMFCGEATVPKEVSFVLLEGNNISSVQDVDGNIHPSQDWILGR